MNRLVQDLRFGLRLLVKDAGFSVVAALTLAVGIGANTAISSVVYGVLVKPLPYREPDRLMRIFEHHPRSPKFPISPANFLDYRRESQSFDAMALFARGDLQIGGGARPEHLAGMQVTSGFFSLLGWQPALGRDFLPEEELAGKHRVVILSNSFWQRQFGSDPDIIGKQVELSSEAYTIVGVLAPEFKHVGGDYRTYGHGDNVDVWSPLVMGPEEQPRFQHYLNGIGRLAPGVSPERAAEEMTAIISRLAEKYPSNAEWSIRVVPLRTEIVGTAEPPLLLLVAAVASVLLIVCVNVAGLLLARSTARVREIALRVALGARRGSIIAQLLTESLVLAFAGGAAGLVLAFWGVDLLVAISPDKIPRIHTVNLDAGMLAFAAGITVATWVLFGLAPALHASSTHLADALKEGARAGLSAGSQRLRRVLVTVELAMAFILL
ncbi:MAG TPA: ABC transporter permease, partial [Blastocatellia bacterium]|nr:ABC transporter permease [Blastocatellia bacterium]